VQRLAFVCTHNSARSQLAAAHWNAHHLALPAVSAGTHPAAAVHPRAVALARRIGLKLNSTGTRAIEDTVAADDLVIAVCDRVHEELPDPLRRMHWSIPDPVALDTDQAFTDAYQQLTDRIDRLGPTLDLEGSA
jgi:ArsR family transcriptional regulator, arsenate/arsenite/antimonite-responsive transcriptional repressor / arsenate reductase (thioredoxin)